MLQDRVTSLLRQVSYNESEASALNPRDFVFWNLFVWKFIVSYQD